MKKLFKSGWLYVFMFVVATILLTNVITTSVIKRNVNKQRSALLEPKVPKTETEYEKEEIDEASTPVLVEEDEILVQNEIPIQEEEEQGFESPLNGEIINKFSGSELVYSKTLKEYRVHNGIDIKAAILSQVKACASGIVESVEKDGLMGITVTIDHQDGFKSVYSNLSSEEMVKAGDSVKKGDIINGVGDTALIETGEEAHLHFELIKDGIQVNPEEYFN